MIVHRTRYARIGELLFGELPRGERVDIRKHLQRPTPLDHASCVAFKTIHIDLSRDEARILAEVKKGTRYEIRRAEAEGVVCRAEPVSALGDFVAFFEPFAAAKQISPVPLALANAYAAGHVLELSRAIDANGETLAWHAYLVANGRARLWLSATAMRGSDTDKARAPSIGRANRLLHWRDMARFRSSGCTIYDLGGWDGTSALPELRGISRFKEELGGSVVEEYNCVEAVTLRGRLYRAAEQVVERRRAHGPVPGRSPRELLRCPEDAGILNDREDGLRCATCARTYPIEDGIVRFVTTLDDSDKASEMRARDAAAEAYDARFSTLRNEIEIPPSLAALDPRADDRVAELGCGSGRMTMQYVDRVASVIALDFSLASLRVLQRKLSPDQRAKVILAQADISKLPIAPESLTKVVSFQVFEHLPTEELRAAAAGAAGRLLARGGKLVLTVYNWNWNKQRLSRRGIGDNTAKQGFHAGEDRVFYFNFEPHDLRRLFDHAKVSNIQMRGLDAQFPGIDRVGRLALPVNRILERIPIGRRLGHLLLATGVK